jgi:hypothetical protein
VSFVVSQRNMAYLNPEAIHTIWPKQMSQLPHFVLFSSFFSPFELVEQPSMAIGMVRPPTNILKWPTDVLATSIWPFGGGLATPHFILLYLIL